MAAFLTTGAGRLTCPPAERRLRPSAKQCLLRCEARCSESGAAPQNTAAKVIFPGILTAALLHSSAAQAGVVLQKSENKKFYQGGKNISKQEKKAEAPSSSGGGGFSLPSFSAPSLPTPSLPGISLPKPPSLPGISLPSAPATPSLDTGADLKGLALPGAIGGIGALAFLASKIDKGFGAFMNESLVKDSTNYTGYEEDEPQKKGSPVGFLGFGNLSLPDIPFGQDAAEKVRSAAAPKGGSGKSRKGTVAIGKSKGKKSKSGGGKGLFGFGK